MLNLREYRSKAKGLPDLLNIAFLVDEVMIAGRPLAIGLTKSGSLIGGFTYAGPDYESSSQADLEALSGRINHAIARLGTGWSMHADLIRMSTASYTPESECHFSDPISYSIDAERRLQHQHEGAHFEARHVIVFGFTLPTDSESKLVRSFVTNSSQGNDQLIEHVKRFASELENIIGIFSGYCQTASLDATGLLTHIHGCLTGDFHRVTPPKIPAFLDSVLGAHELVGGFEPKIDSTEIRVVSFSGWPSETFPEILEDLGTLPFPLRYSIRYLFLDPAEANKKLTVYRRNWFQKRHSLGSQVSQAMGGEGGNFVNADALAMTGDADAAISEASSGWLRYGYMTANIILHAPSAKIANERVKQLARFVNNRGFVSHVETVNALEAWLGSVPGQTFENVRRPLMNTLNLADIMSTTSIWAGSPRNPNPMYRDAAGRAAPPLLWGATSGDTPFRFSLHVDDVGHTFIAGPTGAGKSTLLSLIAAQHLRYKDARVFAFDKGLSLYPLTAAMAGSHYEPGADGSTLAFAPLSRVHLSDEERAWAEEWVESLCVMQDVPVDSGRRARIHDAIQALADAEGDRSVSDFVNLVQDEKVRTACSFYTLTGRSGRLLDAATDELSLDGARFSVFEIDALMANGDSSKKLIAVPTLLYLFHRIEKSLDGSPTLIILDEAWALLDNPLFAGKIREWLKVLRKANAAVVFATQSLADLRGNPLAAVLMESCPTKILLPNREAMSDNLLGLYRDIGLNDHQTRLLQQSTPKSDYYVISPYGRRRITLALGPVALAFVGAADKKSLARIRELVALHGRRWPIHWLRERLPRDRLDWVDFVQKQFDDAGIS